MALQIDASTPSPVHTFNTDVNVSASFTPPDRSLIVLLIAAVEPTFAVDAVTVSGGSLSWSRRATKSRRATSIGGASGVEGAAEIWTAWVDASPGAMSVTVTPQPDMYYLDTAAIVLTGTEGSRLTGQVGASTGSVLYNTARLTLGSVSSGSYIFAAATSFDENGPCTFGSGQTSIQNSTTGFLWRTTSTVSTGSVLMDIATPSGLDVNIAAVEIKAATGGGGPSSWIGG